MSLQVRLTALTGVLTSSAILLFALVFYVVLQDNLLDELDSRLHERADLVTRMVNDATTADMGSTHVPPLVEFDSPGIYVELLGSDGQVQAASPHLRGGRLPSDPALDATARSGQPAIATITAGGDEQLRVLVRPGASGGRLVVAESLEPLERTLMQARTLLLACGVLALGLTTGGAAILTRRALRPMARLTSAAATIAVTGHYHERVPAPARRDEIGQLASTVNQLIATVERTLGQQRQLLADTSHELRSPLTVVLANLSLLRREMGQDAHDICIGEATAEAQRMRRLINDLLLLARADAEQAIGRAPVQLGRVVAETVALAARQSPAYPMRVLAAELVVVGDAERLTQLLRNLIENATHHTPPGTAIDIRLLQHERAAELSVADNGPGIAAEHLPHLWDRFYRVDKARSRALGGTGLGLAIVKYIAEAHGGSVRVASEPGHGTTFTITLPLAPAPAAPVIAMAPRNPEATP